MHTTWKGPSWMATPLGTDKNMNLFHRQMEPFSNLPLQGTLQHLILWAEVLPTNTTLLVLEKEVYEQKCFPQKQFPKQKTNPCIFSNCKIKWPKHQIVNWESSPGDGKTSKTGAENPNMSNSLLPTPFSKLGFELALELTCHFFCCITTLPCSLKYQ